MRSAEKPHQTLSASEKEVFKVCSDVIAWNPKEEQSPELLALRERATALFDSMRRVDLANNDSYYRYAAEAVSLKRSLEELKAKASAGEMVEITGQNIDTALREVVKCIHEGRGARVFFNWVPEDPEGFHTDFTATVATPSAEGSGLYELQFGEIFDPAIFNSLEHVNVFKDSLDDVLLSRSKLNEHVHNEGTGEHETWLTISGLSKEDVEALLVKFSKVMKDNPRVPRDKK